jgi:hypothetical protein
VADEGVGVVMLRMSVVRVRVDMCVRDIEGIDKSCYVSDDGSYCTYAVRL